MDFSQFNLETLQSLHISYQRLLRERIERLNDLPDNEEKGLMTQLLKIEIASYEKDIAEIETRINALNAQHLRFSTEYMEWEFGAFNRVTQVHFITTSDAYKNYGQYVTGKVIIDKEYLPELIEKVKLKAHNDGVIKFEEIVSDEMSDETKEKLRTEGFYASEIDHIENLR